MKRISSFAIFALLVLSMSSCLKDECTNEITYDKYFPVLMTLDEIRQDFAKADPIELKNTGKIYFYGQYMFINEYRQGVHVIDNSDPANPINLAFIKIPGNVDMAVSGNTLYADSYLDVLAINIADPNNPQLINRSEDILARNYPYNESEDAYIVDWYSEKVTEEYPCENRMSLYSDDKLGTYTFESQLAGGNSPSTIETSILNSTQTQGIAGSMARMQIVNGLLYMIDRSQLFVYSLPSEGLNLETQLRVGWDIETLFPYENNLFIGAQSGMYIYDNSDPLAPSFVSKFWHTNSCDPVFVQGDVAFITLRDGTRCQTFSNQLEVVDISDLENPSLIADYPMFNPHGLSVDEQTIYICDGAEGLKLYDMTDLEAITNNLLDTYQMDAYDVIALPGKNHIMVIAKDGFFQFDVTDKTDIELVSLIPVSQ